MHPRSNAVAVRTYKRQFFQSAKHYLTKLTQSTRIPLVPLQVSCQSWIRAATRPQRRRMPYRLNAIALVLALVARASANEYCQLSNKPVCGEDGIEYTNACIARVQGIKIAYTGECGSEETSGSEESTADGIVDTGVYITRSLRITKGRVAVSDILKYKSADYRFVGLYSSENGTIPSQELVCVQDASRELEGTSPNSRSLLQRDPTGGNDRPRVVYRDRYGRHYVQSSRNRGRSPPGRGRGPVRPNFKRRTLLNQKSDGIIGSNDIKTVELGSRLSFPYSAVLKFAVVLGHKRTVCTGALIGRSTLLTAAHCVYDQAEQFFYNYDYYTFHTADLKPLDVKIVNTIVTTQYVLGLDEYDFALVTLDKDFSNTLGYLGYGDACKAEHPHVTLYGYDVPNHNKFSSSTCKLPTTCNKIIAEEQCDIDPGMSGGPLVNSHDIINAIAVGSCGGEYNQAATLQENILSWIDENLPLFE